MNCIELHFDHHYALLAKFIDCIKDKIRSVRDCRHKSGIKQNTASAQIRDWKWNLVRSRSVYEFCGIDVSD
jgi:hypothetical protein